MNESATHVLIEYKTHKSDVLFRAADGIGIAQRKGAMVIIGEDPNRGTSRIFIDEASAAKYLRTVIPAADLAGFDIDFKYDSRKPIENPKPPVLEFRAGEGSIILPSGVDLPQGIRKIN